MNVVLMVGLTAAGLEGTNSFTDSKGDGDDDANGRLGQFFYLFFNLSTVSTRRERESYRSFFTHL